MGESTLRWPTDKEREENTICHLVILKQIVMVSWVLNKVSMILSSAGVVCWLVLGYYSTQCGLR